VDPRLRLEIEAGDPDDELALLVRLRGRSELPAGTRVVSRFGDVATVRTTRGAARALWESPATRSVKAPRSYRAELVEVEAEAVDPVDEDRRRPPGLGPSGRGVVVGMVDWGLDFRHPAFRRPDGNTRLLGLWDQSADHDPGRPNRFGYGRIHERAEIDAALRAGDPVAALGYDPAVWDVGGGTHGTATTSVAAGSAWDGGVEGMAPGAEIVFVNLAGAEGLGHSVAVAEAVDYVREAAGDWPWVVNCSLGSHCGPHDGRTLLEQFLDAAIRKTGGTVVNSNGNYYSSRVHSSARLSQGEILRLPLHLERTAPGANEIDVWYGGADRLLVGLEAPDRGSRALARPDADATLEVEGRPVARIVHRLHDPNNGRNQAVLRIDADAPRGVWRLVLVGAEIVDGRFHVWIERTPSAAAQPRFDEGEAVSTTTTGTICNGLRNLAVGAYDQHDPARPLTAFSSSGETVDGRPKPALLAPGARVLAARSRPRDATAEEAPLSVRMSGTSLAAPFVTGAIACLMEEAGRVPAAQLRVALLESAQPFEGADSARAGSGYLDVEAAAAAVRRGGPPRRRVAPEAEPDAPEPAAEPERTQPTSTEAVMTSMPAPEQSQTNGGASPRGPDDVLRDLGVSARGIFDAYVLGRDGERGRLDERLELLAGPRDRVEGALRAGDLLVRGAMGEGVAFLSQLVTGELLDPPTARREGLELEGRLPGRYAWVVEGGADPHTRDDRFARRVADGRGDLPPDQALLRLTGSAAPVASEPAAPAAASAPAPEWEPEAVDRSSPAYVSWYQRALNQVDGAGLKVDGIVGRHTRAAVRKYQARKELRKVDGIVGPETEGALVWDTRTTPFGTIVWGPPPSAPALGSLESRYFPPSGGADAAPFSRNSTVEPIVDGQDYFAQLLAQVSSLGAGDAWYLTGWWLETGFTFATGDKLGDLLAARAAAGVDVRVIVWANRQALGGLGAALAGPFRRVVLDNIRAAEELRARTVAGATPLAGRVLIDWSGNALSSHHMKLNLFSGPSGLTAFAGGIDYVQNRLAVPPHISGSFWHDAGARVTGDAAERVLRTFVTRWTEASTLSAATYDVGAGPKPFNPPPLAPLTPPSVGLPTPESPDTSVEVVRSFPDSKEFGLIRNTPWTTLPRTGVHETKLTFQTMLAAAQRYIYVEDQAFNAVNSLFPSIVAACRRGVKVIAVVPGQGDPLEAPGKLPAVLSPEVTSGILAQLSPAEQQNLAVWQLDGIVVHSKLILIDDELLSIGSANFMDRSMEFTIQGDDSECTVVAVSTSNLVPDLRVKLWAEHLRVSDPSALSEIRDLTKSLGFWRPAWGAGISFPHPDSRLVFVGPASVPAPTGSGSGTTAPTAPPAGHGSSSP
jgi:phosphatidylserine/phosphatidylglycerophosphate/cardiolipin synthase-like enzyme